MANQGMVSQPRHTILLSRSALNCEIIYNKTLITGIYVEGSQTSMDNAPEVEECSLPMINDKHRDSGDKLDWISCVSMQKSKSMPLHYMNRTDGNRNCNWQSNMKHVLIIDTILEEYKHILNNTKRYRRTDALIGENEGILKRWSFIKFQKYLLCSRVNNHGPLEKNISDWQSPEQKWDFFGISKAVHDSNIYKKYWYLNNQLCSWQQYLITEVTKRNWDTMLCGHAKWSTKAEYELDTIVSAVDRLRFASFFIISLPTLGPRPVGPRTHVPLQWKTNKPPITHGRGKSAVVWV